MAGFEDFLNKYFPPQRRGEDKEFAEGIPQATYEPDPTRRWELSYEGEIPLVGDIPGVRQPTYNIVDVEVPEEVPVIQPEEEPPVVGSVDVGMPDNQILFPPPSRKGGYSRANVPAIPRANRLVPDFLKPEGRPRGLMPRGVTPKLSAPNAEGQPLRLPKPPRSGLMANMLRVGRRIPGPTALLTLPFSANAYQQEGMSEGEAIQRALIDIFGIESLGGYEEDAYFEQLNDQPYSESIYGYPEL